MEGTMRSRALAGAALAATFLLFSGQPAWATQPTVQSFESSGTNVPLEDCGTFLVLATYTLDETITTYYDNSGQPIRAAIRFKLDAMLSNSVTLKKAYELESSAVMADLLTDEARTVGLVLQIRVPGAGVVVLELGKVTIDASGAATVSGGLTVEQGGSVLCSILS
jgi:hypothetical protein